MGIAVQVISDDGELHRLCREILGELPYRDIGIVPAREWVAGIHPEICVWDCSSSTLLPGMCELNGCEKHLFLVERGQVPTILDSLPYAPIGLLLKPITKSALTPFLEQAVALCAARSARFDSDHTSPHSDRDDILQYLLQANLRLQEYDHDRTNFLARAAHDFRAPLTAINGYCGLMLEGALGALSEQQREALQRMQNSAQRLSRMACSLYDLSLARRSQMRIQFSVQPIEDCIDQAVHELAFLTEEKRISITVQLTPYHGRRLSFDPTRIVQLVVNLLDNACRFTPKYGAVEVLGYPFFWERRSGSGPVAAVERRHLRCQEPNCCRLDISDTGPGIPREFVPLIFEEYTSYAGPEDRSGGGLGLAICRTIAQAHGGNIWANSKIDGATFSVVLPFENPEGGRRDRIPWDVSFAGVEDGNGGDSQSREER